VFLVLNAFAEELDNDLPAFVKSFLSALLHLSEMDRYIPSHNHIKNI